MRTRRLLAVAGTAVALSAVGAVLAPASADPIPPTMTRCWVDEGWLYVDGEGYVHVAEDPSTTVVRCVH